jgi:hypothetical protein
MERDISCEEDDVAMSADAGTARHPEAPAKASPGAPNASPGANGSSPEVKKQNSPPSEFPIRLGLNITPAMAASLQRMHRRLRLKEAVIGRLALMQYLASNDPHYREE